MEKPINSNQIYTLSQLNSKPSFYKSEVSKSRQQKHIFDPNTPKDFGQNPRNQQQNEPNFKKKHDETSFITCFNDPSEISKIEQLNEEDWRNKEQNQQNINSSLEQNLQKKIQEVQQSKNLMQTKIYEINDIEKKLKAFNINLKALEKEFQTSQAQSVKRFQHQFEKQVKSHQESIFQGLGKLDLKLKQNEREIYKTIEEECSEIKKTSSFDRAKKAVESLQQNFDEELRRNFEEINSKIKDIDGNLIEGRKKQENFLINLRNNLEVRFKEAQNYFLQSMDSFKASLGDKIDKSQFQETVHKILETKLAEIRSEMSAAQNFLNNNNHQMASIKNLNKGIFQEALGNFENEQKILRENFEKYEEKYQGEIRKNQEMENNLKNFEDKIVGFQEKIEGINEELNKFYHDSNNVFGKQIKEFENLNERFSSKK